MLYASLLESDYLLAMEMLDSNQHSQKLFQGVPSNLMNGLSSPGAALFLMMRHKDCYTTDIFLQSWAGMCLKIQRNVILVLWLSFYNLKELYWKLYMMSNGFELNQIFGFMRAGHI